MATLNPFAPTKRLVLKIGSALLVEGADGALRQDWLNALARDIAKLRKENIEIIIVSSGAIALGRARLGLLGMTLSLPEKQACAAAGQSRLTQAYEKALGEHNITTAQALVTLNDTEDRRRWLNARATLATLLDLGAVPIINENDTVATDEIRYGDNDRLAARAAQMLGADTLILLSDIDGLYTKNPRDHDDAKHLPLIEKLTPNILAMAGASNAQAGVGTGGMVTKLAAAQIAMQAGCAMAIMDGQAPSPLSRLLDGENATWFKPSLAPKDARRQWIAGSLKTKGVITVDAGAAKALGNGKSLLAAGVAQIEGDFEKGDAVDIETESAHLIAKGLISYSAADARAIKGLQADTIKSTLGYHYGDALIHRDNLVMFL